MEQNNKPTFQDQLEKFIAEYDIVLIGALFLCGIALWVVEKLILEG